MTNIIILIIPITLLFISFIIISYFAHNKNLKMIDSKETGNGQYGTDRFATKKEIKDTFLTLPYNVKKWRENKENKDLKPGIIVGYNKNGKNYDAIIDTTDVHALMIGASGIGKTTYFLYPNIEYSLACGVSFLSTDTKGDIYRNVCEIAEKNYGYNISIIDLRNPCNSNGNNFMYLVNHYMDLYLSDKDNISYKAKAEKYAKIIAKTIINSGHEKVTYGPNSYFYDAAEGLLTASILLVSEYCQKEERHIVSVFRIIRELMVPNANEDYSDLIPSNASKKRKTKEIGFKELMEMLPDNHKAKWLASAAISASDQTVASVLSTALSRLNAFIDSELEQILCHNPSIDAEKFASEKSAIFIVLPEEDNTKHFLASLFVAQLYRELLTIADDQGGRLNKKVLFYLDEFGTIPEIQSVDMMFSSSRSRNISIVAIIQSYAQLESNYGHNQAEIISDNTQLTIFGGFSPTSTAASRLSSALGYKTIQSGSLSRSDNKNDSLNIQMIKRELKTEGEIKSMDKGKFIVMKTFFHPMETFLVFYKDLNISYTNVYNPKNTIPNTSIEYATKKELIKKIHERHNISHWTFVDDFEDELIQKSIPGIKLDRKLTI